MGSQPAPSALPPSLPPRAASIPPPSWASPPDLGVWAATSYYHLRKRGSRKQRLPGGPGSMNYCTRLSDTE